MEFRGETIHFTDDEQDLFGVPPELGTGDIAEAIQRLDEEAARSNEHGLALQSSPYPNERLAGQRMRIRAERVSRFSASLFGLVYGQLAQQNPKATGDL